MQMEYEKYLRPFGNIVNSLLGQETYEKVAMTWFHIKMKHNMTNDNVKMFYKFIDAGDICFDIGANRGEITYYLSQLVGQTGKVISFEPITKARFFLKDTIDKFHLTNVVICPRALSNKKDELQMIIPKLNGVDVFALAHLPSKDIEPQECGYRETVQVTTLDRIVEKLAIDRLDFIKIDVEGHEFAVLQGGEKTINKYLPVVYLEVWRTKQTEKEGQLSSDAIDWLREHDYIGIMVNGKNFIDLHMSFIIEHNVQDFFFVPRSKMSFYEIC
jgi:FkbM family methyltransferase